MYFNFLIINGFVSIKSSKRCVFHLNCSTESHISGLLPSRFCSIQMSYLAQPLLTSPQSLHHIVLQLYRVFFQVIEEAQFFLPEMSCHMWISFPLTQAAGFPQWYFFREPFCDQCVLKKLPLLTEFSLKASCSLQNPNHCL